MVSCLGNADMDPRAVSNALRAVSAPCDGWEGFPQFRKGRCRYDGENGGTLQVYGFLYAFVDFPMVFLGFRECL